MNLLSSASIFSFFTIISRILGYLRDILIAIFLGASIFADAFFVAFRLPNTFRRLFAEGTFNAAFIPSYTSAQLKSAAMLAGLNSFGTTTIFEKSKTRDHTENMLRKNSKSILLKNKGNIIKIFGKKTLNPLNIKIF